MRVYVYPADRFACGAYRMAWPAERLQAAGHDIEIIQPGETTGLGLAYDRFTGRFGAPIYPHDADVIVLQRPSHPYLVQAITMIRERGVAVVVDLDDDLDHIHPANPAWAHLHPKSPTDHSWANVREACKRATLVTVSTPALAKRYDYGNTRVLYNYVPAEFLDVPRVDADWIGWAGSTHSHPNDLAPMGVSISRLIGEGVPFRVVGTSAGAGRQLGLIVDPNETGTIEFDTWPEAVATIGVGVAPLADTVFNAAKSWLKPLEYAAVGVPWVGSPRPEYLRLNGLGCGIMAERPREWERALRSIVKDRVLRDELSLKGREVASGLTIEEHAWQWMEAWSDARRCQH